MRRLSNSREQRVIQLLSNEEMGERKPSQFLQHLRGFAPDYQITSGPAVYPQKHRRYLPARLRAVWIQPLTSQAKFSKSPFPLQRVSPLRSPTAQPGCLSALRELKRQVASLRASQTRSRSHSRNRTSNTPNYHSAPSDICW